MEKTALSQMERKMEFSWLLAFYGDLLTENQQELAHLSWEEDFTLAEIAAQYDVSRQSVHDTLNRVEKKLLFYEEKLGLVRRFQVIEDGLRTCQAELAQVTATTNTQSHLAAARRQIGLLLEREEE